MNFFVYTLSDLWITPQDSAKLKDLIKIYLCGKFHQYSICDSNVIRTHNYLVCNGWMFVFELSGCGFESRCYHLNFKIAPASSKKFLDIQVNYTVWIHFETCTWHDNNIQSIAPYR